MLPFTQGTMFIDSQRTLVTLHILESHSRQPSRYFFVLAIENYLRLPANMFCPSWPSFLRRTYTRLVGKGLNLGLSARITPIQQPSKVPFSRHAGTMRHLRLLRDLPQNHFIILVLVVTYLPIPILPLASFNKNDNFNHPHPWARSLPKTHHTPRCS